MRRLNLASLPAITSHIPNPQIIRENKDNIRPVRRLQGECD